MQDGTICAGEVNGQRLFAAPTDAAVTMKFNEAAQYAKKLNKEKYLGHNDWRVPTKDELNLLYQNREKGALSGTFNLTGSYPAGWYWSSAPYGDVGAWCQNFGDGDQDGNGRNDHYSVRCVRSMEK